MKSIGKVIIAVVLTLCTTLVRSYGQSNTGHASGIVTDQGGTPLPGATVEASANGKRVNIAVSDSIGKFVFKNLPSANLTFNVSMIGYDTKSFSGYKIIPGQNTALSFALTSTVSELSSVVVIGYGTRKRQDVTGAVAKADLLYTKTIPQCKRHVFLEGYGFRSYGGTGYQGRQRSHPDGTRPELYFRHHFPADRGRWPYLQGITHLHQPLDIASIDLLKDASAAACMAPRHLTGWC